MKSFVSLFVFLLKKCEIAFAYELADGNDPSDVSFDQGKMRQHLVQCLEKGRLEAFPRQLNAARFNKRQTYDKHIF